MGSTPELSQKWWRKNKASTLKSTGLGAVLGSYEKAQSDLEKALRSEDWAKIQEALDDVDNYTGKLIPAAVKKAEGMCDKKQHKETLDILDGYDKALRQEAVKTAAMVKPVRSKIEGELDKQSKKITGVAQAALNESNTLESDARKMSSELDKLVRNIQKAASKSDRKSMESDAEKAKGIVAELSKSSKRLRDLQGDVRDARRSWTYKPGTLGKGSKDPYGNLGDTIETIMYGIESKADEVDDALKDALKSENEILKIFDGEANERELYQKSCVRLTRVHSKVMSTIDASARTIGGDIGNARADVINCSEEKDSAKQQKMLKRLLDRVSEFDKQSKDLDKQAREAKKALDDEMSDLPDFVKNDKEFKGEWDALTRLQKSMDDVAKDAAQTIVDAGKFERDVKALAAKLK